MSRAVVKCEISSVSESNKSFTLSYRVLEENDGCSIKIFYIGKKYPETIIETAIVGVPEVEIFSDTLEEQMDQQPWYKNYKRYTPGLFLLLIISVCLFFIHKSNIQIPRFRLVFCFIISAQIFMLLEIRLGNSYFSINFVKPNTEQWILNSPNKPLKQDK
ncbi:hypothetical protein P4S65_19310 [Pseudoalteromonas sp. B131b]|uniref:hypothetical protein n=1 Tax=Pseudoalteromonas sp. B131b TaxID=630493 RepID=UPI00301E4C18